MEKIVYNVGICDDEQGTCLQLKDYLEKLFAERELGLDVHIWNEGESFCEDLRRGCEINILFLDIKLPMKNGVEVGHYIRDDLHNSALDIIFISSTTNYAMELFQVHPFDFITKPFDYDYMDRMLEKLLFWNEQDKRHYSYISHKTMYRLPFGKIMYLRSDNKHIHIHMSDKSMLEFTGKLVNEINKFPAQFVRISKSYIINMKYISQCRPDSVTMLDNIIISVTKPYRQDFKDKLCRYNSGGITGWSNG
ncbi:MAG: LytTR family DNA-binding domain-containing protein [Butyrivibrio sp.]|nr:LytTR family DNA-binding domain-containing protein [Muribaculum sp.]MCM1553680.1 LytTR family DNA-binding domain-containing protein [Butyrivibrio sp.]